MTSSERLRTGLLLFPGITPLDAAGPYEVLARAPELDVLLIAKTKGETRSELGLALLADEDFASAPDLDILCVPGGKGIVEAASDAATIDFLKRQGREPATSPRSAPARFLPVPPVSSEATAPRRIG
jgi:cyclohexyl-isocyanide hydratase